MVQDNDDDDEIQIIATLKGEGHNSFLCQFCHQDLVDLSIPQRQRHYERHFQTNTSADLAEHGLETPRTTKQNGINFNRPGRIKLLGSKQKSPRKWKMRLPCHETDLFWYSALTEPPPSNFTPGLVPLLKKALCKSHSQGFTRRATLCHPSTVHIHREVWDHGWGCGYRNYLMVCSALLCQQMRPEYHHLIISDSRRPGVRSLQRLIQEAWNAGYDQEGQEQLKELVGTSKWIGTSDLYIAFTFCGIPCELIEFNLGDSEDRSPDALVNWVVDYFTSSIKPKPSDVNEALRGASPMTTTERMPLILQHHGHSRTIIGYEIPKDGATSLLVFDPNFSPDGRLRAAAIDTFSQPDSLKRPVSDCIVESSTRYHPAKRMRSAMEPIDVDNADHATNQSGTSMRGGTHSLHKLLPSSEKLSQRLLGACRLSRKKLSKEKRYQILYFPMSTPLTDEEKAARKVVTGAMAP